MHHTPSDTYAISQWLPGRVPATSTPSFTAGRGGKPLAARVDAEQSPKVKAGIHAEAARVLGRLPTTDPVR